MEAVPTEPPAGATWPAVVSERTRVQGRRVAALPLQPGTGAPGQEGKGVQALIAHHCGDLSQRGDGGPEPRHRGCCPALVSSRG